MPKYEIIPPSHNKPLARMEDVTPTRRNVGFIESIEVRVNSRINAKANEALTRLRSTEVALTNVETQLINSEYARRNALAALHEQPERLGHQLTLNRMARMEEYRQQQHLAEMNEARRIAELAETEVQITKKNAELTLAKVALADAEQQLQAQRRHGGGNYDLAFRMKAFEIVDYEPSDDEKQSLLKVGGGHEDIADEDAEIGAALNAYKQQIEAVGGDTSKIDAILKQRKRK